MISSEAIGSWFVSGGRKPHYFWGDISKSSDSRIFIESISIFQDMFLRPCWTF